MTLKEKLATLTGKTVRIGGGAGNGWFYCGEVFNGLTALIDIISEAERDRLIKKTSNARRVYRDRENCYAIKIKHAEKSVSVLKLTLDDFEKQMMEQEDATEFRRLRKRADDTRKTLALKTEYLERLKTPEQKERQFKAWEIALDNAEKELYGYKALIDCDITDTYPSIGGKAMCICLKSSIVGKYWDEDEAARDGSLQSLIADCKLAWGW